MREEDRKDFSTFLEEFQSETDRGAALVGAALIDQKLGETIRAFLVDAKSSTALIEGSRAPLGPLAARISAAHALGLIDDYEASECNLIRKVRNEFAHGVHGTSYSDKRIKGLCASLTSDLPGGRDGFSGNHRAMFVNAVVIIVMRLTYRAEYVARERRKVRA